MKAKLRDFWSQLTHLPRTLRLVWAAAPGWTLAWAILLVIEGLLPAAIIYLTRSLVDSLAAALGTGVSWQNVQPTLLLAGLMAGLMLLTQVIQGIIEWVRTAQSEYIKDHLSALIHNKAATVDLAFYESSIYHDRLYRAHSDLQHRPLAILENSGSLLQSAITLVAMATLLIPYGVWLPLALLAGTLPALWVALRFNWQYHRWWEQTTPDRRRAQYYDARLTVDVVAAELRLFDLGPYFQSAYQKLRCGLRTGQLQLIKQKNAARLVAGVVATLVSGGALIWMGWQAFMGLATLGDLALFYQAFNKGQSLLRSLLGNLGQIYSNTLFLANLFEFLDLEPQIVDPPQPIPTPTTLQKGVRFRQVTFRYPGSERPVFQDFDLFIPAGKVVAIVGANGAGKTTLIKLLCRFYDPEVGRIEFDGSDIKDFSPGELRRMITVHFQFPVPYFSTVANNIAMGDLEAAPSATEIEAAARGAGAHEFIARLPQGYDTLLGKWFAGGTELSGGEWHRLALARAFLRKAEIIILDEPTSHMDSWAEIDWYDRFQELANGRTAVVISHRLTVAKRADIIYVMENGQVAESGSHDELLAKGGPYAQSWTAQIQSRASQPDLITNASGQVSPTVSNVLLKRRL